MNIFIKEIQEKKQWNNFLYTLDTIDKTFLHSWQWGKFNYEIGNKNYKLGIYNKDELIGVALVLKIIAKRGTFLFIPHGPIIKYKGKEYKSKELKIKSYKKLIDYLKILAKKENASFIRISPILEDNKENRKLFKEIGFRQAPSHMHAERTLIVDISKSEDEILSKMRKTTRNLIRQSLKKQELKLYTSNKLDNFYDIYNETVKRQGFTGFTKKYLQEELNAFENDVLIFLVKYDNKFLAGALVIFFDDTAYYHQAASIHSKLPAAYLMNWEIIKEAKKRGCKFYNMWGIVEENDKNHPWFGLSLFKRGFGGQEVNLMKAQDIPLTRLKYFINWIIETIRTKKRNY